MVRSDNILVTVFLRGGCDGLNLVGPTGDSIYMAERRTETRVERDGDNPGLKLGNPIADVDFRFHYKAAALKELYDANELAVVHACGLTNGTRSHFEAIDFMERGTPDNKNTSTGWLTRLVAQEHLSGYTPVVSASNGVPISLLACASAIAVPNTKRVTLQGSGYYKGLREEMLHARYTNTPPISKNGAHTLEVLDVFSSRLPKDASGKLLDYQPAAGVNYTVEGNNELSNGLKALAQLIKMDVGVRVAMVDYGGWDTHIGQNGRFPPLVSGLSQALKAFWLDMKSYQDRLTLVVMSEFGRRLKSNDSGGTDHGHGNVMLVMGGQVNGGHMYGKWPGLSNEQLDNQVDLAVTTDYRTVLAEIAQNQLPQVNIGKVFPGFTSYQPLNIMRA